GRPPRSGGRCPARTCARAASHGGAYRLSAAATTRPSLVGATSDACLGAVILPSRISRNVGHGTFVARAHRPFRRKKQSSHTRARAKVSRPPTRSHPGVVRRAAGQATSNLVETIVRGT